jgi:hypothetical protein
MSGIRPKMGDDFTYSNNPDGVWKIELESLSRIAEMR